MAHAEFAYAQARLQARLGQRPDAGDWRSLEASRSAVHLLALAQGGPLGRWVQGIDGTAAVPAAERGLLARWQREADAVADWVPARWRAAVACFARLPALAAAPAEAGPPPLAAWQRDWRRVLPADARRLAPAIDRPAALLLPRLAGVSRGRSSTDAGVQRALQTLIRRWHGTAVAVFAYLALQALDVERLRGDLVVRVLFAPPAEA